MARQKQRENYGSGSIIPRKGKDGKQAKDRQGRLLWTISLYFGQEEYTDKNGNRRQRQNRIQRVVHGTIADARRARKELMDQYENVDVSAAKERTFGDACDAWETSMRNSGRASENALNGYLCNLRHMRAIIGKKELVAITKQDVEDALGRIRNERGLSGTSMRKIYGVTKRVFTYSVNSDWLVRNPCATIDAPRNNEVVNRRSLSEQECQLFAERLDWAEIDAVNAFNAKERRVVTEDNARDRSSVWGISNVSCIIALRLELATGMRRSEVCGLTWAAVDLERRIVTVRQNVIEEKGTARRGKRTLRVKSTKTSAGVRQISIDKATASHLVYWKMLQKDMLGRITKDGEQLTQTEDTPVCISDKGGVLPPSRITSWWGSPSQPGFRHQIGFPDLVMHELRHTQATMLLGKGVDIKTVQHRLGHAKATLTLDMYAHAIPANDHEAAQVMGKLTDTGAESKVKVGLISIEQYEARTRRRKQRKQSRTAGRREPAEAS